MSSEFIHRTIQDFVCRITLDRPPVNALNQKMITELNNAIEEIQSQIDNDALRVVLFDSNCKHFCAGADLKERQQISADQVESVVERIRQTFQRVYELPIVTIAAIHGSAVGGGLEFALAADLRIISEEAKVGLPETSLAIIPGAGGTQRLPRLIGTSKSLYWITTGKIFSGTEAFQTGVADILVKDEKLKRTSLELAKSISRNGPIAVRAAKQAIRTGLEFPLKKALEIEKEQYGKVIDTEDRLEGIRAFIEKRAAKYQNR